MNSCVVGGVRWIHRGGARSALEHVSVRVSSGGGLLSISQGSAHRGCPQELLASPPASQLIISCLNLLRSWFPHLRVPPLLPPPLRVGLVFLQMFVFSAADENIHYLVSCLREGGADLHFSQLIKVAQAVPVTQAGCSPLPPLPSACKARGFPTLQSLPLSPPPPPGTIWKDTI